MKIVLNVMIVQKDRKKGASWSYLRNIMSCLILWAWEHHLFWSSYFFSDRTCQFQNMCNVNCKSCIFTIGKRWNHLLSKTLLYRVAEIAGFPPRLTSFRIISPKAYMSLKRKGIFGTTSSLFCSILGPIWSIFIQPYLM